MEDEHDKLHYEGGRGSLRLHVSPLEAGLLPTPNFHERVPRLCDSCFSLFECQHSPGYSGREGRVRLRAQRATGRVDHYRTAPRLIFGPLKGNNFPRRPGREFMSHRTLVFLDDRHVFYSSSSQDTQGGSASVRALGFKHGFY